jgi:hypothetical protein
VKHITSSPCVVLNMRQIINLSRLNIKIINQNDMGDKITVNARARGVQDNWLGWRQKQAPRDPLGV